MTALSDEQRAVVEAPTGPLSVIACAGSGKTRTAVHRLVEMRRHLGEQRGHVALLSFSNVAVDTSIETWPKPCQPLPDGTGSTSTRWMRLSRPTFLGHTRIARWVHSRLPTWFQVVNHSSPDSHSEPNNSHRTSR